MRYIVHICDDGGLRANMIADRFSDIGEFMTTCQRLQKDGSIAAGDYLSISTHHFDDERTATEFAKYAARNKPTYNVYIAKVEALVTTEVPTPIIKKVTDKGTLPL